MNNSVLVKESILEIADRYRLEADQKLEPETQSQLGQFMTSKKIASFMASLFQPKDGPYTLLDPGAGVGSLTAAFVQEIVAKNVGSPTIQVDAYELDDLMVGYLERTLQLCRDECKGANIDFEYRIFNADFIEDGVETLWQSNSLFGSSASQYSHCIMNPPYKKIRSSSAYRKKLRQIGIESTNLYSAFLAIAIKMLAPGGQLVAIVPRSFCNGVYFKPFRQLLLSEMAIKQLHVFNSRTQAFKENKVLQENIILYAVKQALQGKIQITASNTPELDDLTHRTVEFEQVVNPNDSDKFIHIATSDLDQIIVDRINTFNNSIYDLGIEVSTGPVVDFRLKDDLRQLHEAGTVPLIYANHFYNNQIRWPNPTGKKPNAIRKSDDSQRWLMPNGWYVLTRRFSSKEEKKRIVAAICDPEILPEQQVGFENHVNVFHQKKNGLDALIAKGLAVYLNSTLLDLYFRQFSGHTQVNATDLRTLHYPSLDALARLGTNVNDSFPTQSEIDALIEIEIERLSPHKAQTKNPMSIKQKIHDALFILDSLGMPRAQRNERSALTLLALVGLMPAQEWSEAQAPLMGITPIMDFIQEQYAKQYAPNTRETIRRQTMHQFVDAGISIPNPDQHDRPTNSPKWVYQIEPTTLALLQSFGSPRWEKKLESYLAVRHTLVERYARRREMEKIPLTLGDDQPVYLTPGAHNKLIQAIIEEFGPRFTPGAEVLYIGDTGEKLVSFNETKLKNLGVALDNTGKFPDVILYYPDKNWLLLVEAVTSHGPIDPKRQSELEIIFSGSTAGLVYVTAFPDRTTMKRYLDDLSWETEVWVAATPTHMIHFNGKRFLGPYA